MLLIGLTSCAGRGASSVPDLAHDSLIPQPAQVMSLIGRWGLAHACPVDEHILTAAHVAARMGTDYGQYPMSYVYQQGAKSGLLTPSQDHPPSTFVDLAWFDVNLGDVPDFNPRAKTVSIGEKVYWFEFDYSRKKVLRKEKIESKVSHVIAGHLSTDRPFTRGASGGCIFNEAGEVVGIPIWRIGYGGVGVQLTEQWNW